MYVWTVTKTLIHKNPVRSFFRILIAFKQALLFVVMDNNAQQTKIDEQEENILNSHTDQQQKEAKIKLNARPNINQNSVPRHIKSKSSSDKHQIQIQNQNHHNKNKKRSSASSPFALSKSLILQVLLLSDQTSTASASSASSSSITPPTTPSMSNPMDCDASTTSTSVVGGTFYTNPQNSSDQLDKVCIIGSGNWGSAISTIVGKNCHRLPFCENQVNMWVFEETITVDEATGEKRKLTEIINERHENIKYLPGIALPTNINAVPDLADACKDATLLIFVLPHQFLPKLLPIIRKSAHPSCRGVSLIKGIGKFLL